MTDWGRQMTHFVGDECLPDGHRAELLFSVAVPACRVCGCTDDRACPGGCAWVEADLCTSCVGGFEPEAEPAARPTEAVPAESGERQRDQ